MHRCTVTYQQSCHSSGAGFGFSCTPYASPSSLADILPERSLLPAHSRLLFALPTPRTIRVTRFDRAIFSIGQMTTLPNISPEWAFGTGFPSSLPSDALLVDATIRTGASFVAKPELLLVHGRHLRTQSLLHRAETRISDSPHTAQQHRSTLIAAVSLRRVGHGGAF